ncbi:hypothetical protein ACJJTC_002277 [Scirpophaga incertulas]
MFNDITDGDIPQLLQQWGLPQYIDTFKVLIPILVKSKIFKLALSKSHVSEIKDILEQLQLLNKDNENYEEIESILAFMLLPLLLGNPTHKTKKQVWRPSKAEVMDGFITHVMRPMDVQVAIAQRREKYLKYNLTLQPRVCVWNFIQLGLYQLKTKWDKNYSTVNAFITDLDFNP